MSAAIQIVQINGFPFVVEAVTVRDLRIGDYISIESVGQFQVAGIGQLKPVYTGMYWLTKPGDNGETIRVSSTQKISRYMPYLAEIQQETIESREIREIERKEL